MMSETSERVSVFTHTIKASGLRDCGIPKTLFLPDGVLLSTGHFHTLTSFYYYCQNPSGFCPVGKLGLLSFKPR